MVDNKILSEDLNFLFEIGTTRKLKYLLANIPKDINNIDAAIAYTTEKRQDNAADISLIDLCLKNKIKLNYWGLFNSQGGTAISEIRKALNNPDLIQFYPFSENFHAKVIYFHGYGIYIGSHNFTYNALMYNVEAGTFVKEKCLSEKQKNDIQDFFKYLKEHSIPIVQDDLDKLEDYEDLTQAARNQEKKIKKQMDDYFDELFSHLFNLKQGVRDYGKDKENKIEFLKEWRSTQNIIEHIQNYIRDNCKQPSWINKEVDLSIITDQLLHGYYYSFLLKGKDDRKSGKMIADEKEKNQNNTDYAIMKAIKWWENLTEAPSNENIYINNWGLNNKTILSKLKDRPLTEQELETVLSQNHAARTHARQMSNKSLNLKKDYSTNQEERVKLYSKWLYKQKSKDGLSINDVLKYLLFDESDSLEDRIYNCVKEKHYKIEHFGRSIIGELIGWGRPDITHIRNNRVNKVLNCLGYDVQLFSE